MHEELILSHYTEEPGRIGTAFITLTGFTTIIGVLFGISVVAIRVAVCIRGKLS